MAKVDPSVLHQCWVHAHEEDTDSEMVFRPDSYNFPPSRGRQSFDLKADGSLIRTGIGPTDRTQQTQGHWKLEDGEKLEFYTGSDPAPSRVMEIAEADKDRLVVKK